VEQKKQLRRMAACLFACLFSFAIVSCDRQNPTAIESSQDRNKTVSSQLTEKDLQRREYFWEVPRNIPEVLDSLSLVRYPLVSNEKSIRFRKLKSEVKGIEVYEVGYYNQATTLLKTEYLKWISAVNSIEQTDIKEIISLLPMESVARVLSKPAATTSSECTYDWGYTPEKNRGKYFEHANFGGRELGWIQPPIPYTPSYWMVTISNLHQAPWWFNDIMSSYDVTFDYKSHYCPETDVLERRFFYTSLTSLWKDANFSTRGFGIYQTLIYESPPFYLHVVPGSIDNFNDICWEATPFGCLDDANDDVSSIKCWLSIDAHTY